MANAAVGVAEVRGSTPYEPIIANRAAAGARFPIRVTLLNAASGKKVEGIARCLLRQRQLCGANLILVCEADWNSVRIGNRKFPEELANHLGMSMAFVPEFGLVNREGATYGYMGNAMLSCEPIEDVIPVPIPTQSFHRLPRGVYRRRGGPTGFIASVRFGGERLRVGVVHLDSRCSPPERDAQMEAYLSNFPAGGRAILAGDFNTTTSELRTPRQFASTVWRILIDPSRFRNPERYEPLFERIAAAGFEIRDANVPNQSTFTFSKAIPPMFRPKLDWIAVRGVKPVPGSAAVVRAQRSFFSTRVSDHDFIVVDVSL